MPDVSGSGYWVVTQTGYVYSFGDAPHEGAPNPVTSAVRTPGGGVSGSSSPTAQSAPTVMPSTTPAHLVRWMASTRYRHLLHFRRQGLLGGHGRRCRSELREHPELRLHTRAPAQRFHHRGTGW